MAKSFEIDPNVLWGVALVLDISPNDVESWDIESLLLNEITSVRNSKRAKADALDEVLKKVRVKYDGESDEIK